MQQPHVIPMSDRAGSITRADIMPTSLPDDFITSELAQRIIAYRLPRYGELPDIGLYREQLIAYIEQVLAPLDGATKEAWITPSMVNNYVKIHLIPQPQNKRYGREHVARLIVICIFKQVLSITAIAHLFRIQKMTYPVDTAYNYVAIELEHALTSFFSTEPGCAEDTASRVTRETLLVRSAVLAFAAKEHLVSYLSFLGLDDESDKR